MILRDNVGIGGQADGLVVGIIDEKAARVISAGTMGDEAARPVDGDTLFQIGSITKVFTILLLMDMVQQGQMKLDDPAQRYLPDSVKMPTRGGRQITLFDLATHSSGLPRDWSDGGGPTDTVEQLYDFLSRCQLGHDPGTEKHYSNLGVGLLGHIISLKAGKDYETLVVERICRPLGMDSTRITLTPELKARAARGHAFPGRPVRDMNWDGAVLPGAGAIRSTANDLLKFLSANLGMASPPLADLMRQSQAVQELDSGRRDRLVWNEDAGVLHHGGLVGGFRANLGFDPVQKRGVVILANCASSRMPVAMLGHLLRGRPARPARVAPIDSGLLDRYVGEYRFRGGATCTVRRDGQRLLLQVWRGQPRYPMPYLSHEVFPQSQTLFYEQMWDNRVRFVCNARGQATRLVINNPRDSIKDAVGVRISSQIPSPPTPVKLDAGVYDGYVGQYRPALLGLIPVGPTLNVYRTSDKLGEHLMGYVQGVPGVTRGELHPYSQTSFFNADMDGSSLVFRRGRSGRATRVLVHIDGTDVRGVRVADRPNLPGR
ncbi:serine hydrolase [Fontivita pretiosa]|uniref:serine hydrolase n=1 Tax=Fontivita pretiosa TaxID=2989684 RepID=UPI003D17B93F